MKFIPYIVNISLFVFNLFTYLLAQERELRFEHIGSQNGMRIVQGFSALKCSHGFMWFTTDNGLFRYDGNDFKQFKYSPSDSTSISDNFLMSILFEDNDGYLWIGTASNGVNKFDCLTEKFVRYIQNPLDSNSISHNKVFKIFQDRFGDIWIATFGGGLNKYLPETNSFKYYKIKPNQPNYIADFVMSIYEDNSGIFWIGTFDGLYQFDKKKKYLQNSILLFLYLINF